MTMLNLFLSWLTARLGEPSTWRGAVWIATALGVSLSPDAWAHITTIGMGAAGLLGVLTREEPTRVDIHLPPPLESAGPVGVVDAGATLVDRRAVTGSRMPPPVPTHNNTAEAADIGSDHPGWGS